MSKIESTESALILDDYKQLATKIESSIDFIDDKIRHYESVLDELVELGQKPGVKKMTENVREQFQ